MVGARYKEVTDEVLLYALGFWGEEEARSIDADLKDRLLAMPRARELAKLRPPEMSLKEFRAKFGGDSVSDDDKLLKFFAGADAVAIMKAAGAPKDYISSSTPLVTLIQQIARRREPVQIYIRRSGMTLRMERRQSV
jgi:pyruvate/oxaloacetate carboxyltransferase